jgi:hypothetical protein
MEGRKSKTSAPVIIAIAINSLEQLNAISAAANNYAGLRKNYKLTADISGVTTPIGAVSGGRFVPFTGDFDGNGHTVTVNITSGLTIPSGPLAGTYAGLFAAAGELSGDPGTRGTIHDLKVSGTINIKISADRMLCAGGVVGGMLPTASVSKVVSSVDVSASGKGMAAAGGIAGGLQGGTVSNASASGNISATTTSTSDDIRAHAGGIAGAVMGAVVSRVYATGNVSATSSGDDAQAGGVVGSADDDSDVNNVYATGNVSATGNGPEAHARAGGVMGNIHNGGTLSYAYATGDISVTVSTKSGQAAGIVGNLDPGSVHNTVALNGSISISGTSYEKAARRVIGRITGTMADNYGKADLTPSGGSGSMDKGANRQDGEDLTVTGGPLPTAYTAPNENWWKNTGFSGADWTTVWQWDSAKGLPVLR